MNWFVCLVPQREARQFVATDPHFCGIKLEKYNGLYNFILVIPSGS